MKPLRIGIVAGEVSGDLLGAGLIAAIKKRYPDAKFEGIGGPRMVALGCASFVPMERLSVMGLVEVLGRLFELLGIRRRLRQHFIKHPPDVFIGIDAPDFTLALEKQLRRSGIKTVQYVSPQIWAWRQGRVKHIARCVDLILALFPFERDFYRQHQVQVEFVGHPLADEIPLHSPKDEARQAYGLSMEGKVLALLPGSRMSEIKKMAPLFFATAAAVQKTLAGCQVLVAAANDEIAKALAELQASAEEFAPLRIVTGQARQVMAAADALLVTSGTVTLEATLVKRPMVVAYRMSPLTYRVAKRLVKSAYIALPNLLAGRALVGEFIQDEARVLQLTSALLPLLNNPENEPLQQAYLSIHEQLRQNASERAAQAVLELIGR